MLTIELPRVPHNVAARPILSSCYFSSQYFRSAVGLASGRASGHQTSASTNQNMSHHQPRGGARRGGVAFMGNRLTRAVARKNDVKPNDDDDDDAVLTPCMA
jgi:hypothetical protein